MEYTKGEWRWEWESGQPTVRAHNPKDPLCLIAKVYPKIGIKVFAPIEEAEANAHLIAAAPDNYEANKAYDLAIANAVMALIKGDKVDVVVETILLPAQVQGRSARAKAGGK